MTAITGFDPEIFFSSASGGWFYLLPAADKSIGPLGSRREAFGAAYEAQAAMLDKRAEAAS